MATVRKGKAWNPKTSAKRGRPVGSKNKPKTVVQGMSKADLAYHDRIKAERDQLADELKNAITEVEWYRKQVNHFLALLNIVIRGQ